MILRTELNLLPSSYKLTHKDKLLTIGSCFSQVIGERLVKNKFEGVVNPFGAVFNPISIFRLLENSVSDNFSILDSSVEAKSVWFNYHVHSEIYGVNKEDIDLKLTNKLKGICQYLFEANTLIITLGTAFIYRLKSNNEIVANCHKQTASEFIKELLSVEEIVSSFIELRNQLKIKNSKLKIILTVSPVRHTKDTLQLNSVSKSVLRLACHDIVNRFPEVDYFPSYEIMMDDLRDYRFYKEDLIHPTEVAEEYIWDKFSDTYFGVVTKEIIKEWSSVYKALQHKPFREDTSEYKKFLSETLKRLESLEKDINVKEEVNLILRRL
jgi:hypothetical protein